MKTTNHFLKKFHAARTGVFTICFLLAGFLASAQSETHDFITYDTAFKTGSGSGAITWTMRISRPRHMFTPNHPDNAPRPVLLTMPGMGETGTNPANLAKFGPHYYMANGWDGSVVLANGKHYPILITVIPSYVNPRAPVIAPLVEHLLNTYRIKRNSVHTAGLSMGGGTWTSLIAYQKSPNDETGMKLITSIVALQGGTNATYAPFNAWAHPGFQAFAVWAQKYKGKFFSLEGIGDTRKLWQISEAMNATVPGSAYFAFENIGGGGHCCWNSMYNPAVTDWTSTNPNIVHNSQHPNTPGTYKKGSNIFQWMLRQGDTSLVGGGVVVPPNVLPTVDAGAAKTIVLPINTIQLSATANDADGTIVSRVWTKTAGPAQFAISNTTVLNPVLTNLAVGTYTFRLTVTDNSGGSAFDNVNITINSEVVIIPDPTPPSGGQQINVSIFGGTNPYNHAEWNNWNILGSGRLTSPVLKYSDGSNSTVKATLSQSTGLGDNTATYQGGMVPAAVLRYTSYSTMARSLTITGLTPSTAYTLELFGSRKGVTNNKTIYHQGSKKDTVNTDNNHNDKGILSLNSDNTGKIVIQLTRTNVYTYLNGFTIRSQATGGALKQSSVNEEETSSFNVFPNPFKDRMVLQVNNDQTGSMKVQLIDIKGSVSKEFNLSKNLAGSTQTYLSAGNLPAGEYILKVTIGEWTESKIIVKQ
jgi:hypothetical protein